MAKKLLFVDDEPNLLCGVRRTLRGTLPLVTATSGAEGLERIASDGPFSVIVSDMRMPGMSGVEFLERAQAADPCAVRVMLTGNGDQQTATEAVNRGAVFRFLTKPCSPRVLRQTLSACYRQHQLLTAERELLEQTLRGSVQVLVDVLSVVCPAAFGRACRIKETCLTIAEKLGVETSWHFEVAALLSQVGYVTLPEALIKKTASGEPLTEDEAALLAAHPQTGATLVRHIPRLEPVARLIVAQHGDCPSDAPIEERILRAAVELERRVASGQSSSSAAAEMMTRGSPEDLDLLSALSEVARRRTEGYVETISVQELAPGQVLCEDVVTPRGNVLVTAGREVTHLLAMQLMNQAMLGGVVEPLVVRTCATDGGSRARAENALASLDLRIRRAV